jgi:hypothetical protein
MKLPRASLVLALLAVTAVPPVAAHHTPTHTTCAPISYALSGIGWYELLNNGEFLGTASNCTDWIYGSSIITSSACFNDKAARLTSGSGTFRQPITVTAGLFPLEVDFEFAILGTPTTSDRIYLELWEAGVLRERLLVSTNQGPFNCHRAAKTFAKIYPGRTLEFRFRAVIVTPGVEFHMNYIQIIDYENGP